jgi:AcrR family transcriptional regulator
MASVRTQQQRVEESSQRLMSAAITLIAERGYSQTTAKDIGLRAGYSRAMVAERFGDKDALLDALLIDYYEDQIRVDESFGTSGLDVLFSPVNRLIELVENDPTMARAMLVLNFEAAHDTGLLRDRISKHLSTFLLRLGRAAETGQVDGSIRQDIDPTETASEVMATGIGLAYGWIVLRSDADFADTLRKWRDRVVSSIGTGSRPGGSV